MAYRLKTGIVLFELCGESYLFPSRRSGVHLGFLITVPPALAALLRQEPGAAAQTLHEEERKKLQRLLKMGFVEEC